MSPTEKLLASLEKVRPNGRNKWMACCPAHDDGSPSLAIKETDDGRVLLHCFAGCSAADVMASLGMSLAELFDEPMHASKGERWRPSMPAADALRSMVKDAYLLGVIASNIRNTGEIDGDDMSLLVDCIARMDATLIASGVKRYELE